jgi:diaminopimelate epimerase
MKLRFTKMHGAGNDFVMLDGIRQSIDLTREQWRFLADRHFGVGADQMLLVEKSTNPKADFNYRIFNADGGEVEHCGNGARCFVRFVNEQGLSSESTLTVNTLSGLITLQRIDESRVRVNMGPPRLALQQIPFDAGTLASRQIGEALQFAVLPSLTDDSRWASLVSMGNPHAVIDVSEAAKTPVELWGIEVQSLANFPEGVNVGFMQVLDRTKIQLRVYERGVGETIACGTGACAAVVAGILEGRLDSKVAVTTGGGVLEIEWLGGTNPVMMTGPTATVFTGDIELPH